jgi:stearoyl-CoA desaturase (delta-9 desaturase)
LHAHLANRNADGSWRINWIPLIVFTIFHIGTVVALFNFSWLALGVAVLLYCTTLSWGIGMGYHRLLTHRGYQVPKWIEYALTVFGTMTLEGGPMAWVAIHRKHHQFSDKEGDPHSPREGALWAHVGWMMVGEAMHNQTAMIAKYVPDLARDKFHVWISKYHWLPLTLLGLGLWAAFGWQVMLWGIMLRVTLGLHATWAVNSAAHLWGYQRFNSRDDSRNNWWVAVLSFGEGWHNNHHAHPVSARHGLAWFEFDPTWLQIRFLELIGLAKKVKVAKLREEVPVIAEAA